MAQLNRSALSSRVKGRPPMLAADMFEDKSIQVFDRTSGNYLGLVRNGQQVGDQIVTTSIDEETGIAKIEVNPAQISLF